MSDLTREFAMNDDDLKRRDLERNLILSNLPRRLWEADIEIVPDLPYKNQVREWARQFLVSTKTGAIPRGLYLYGPPSSGKTSISAFLLRWFTQRRIWGLWLNFDDLSDVKQENPIIDIALEEGLWDTARRIRLLVVDGVGYWHDTKVGRLNVLALEKLFRDRWDNGLCTVMSSNFSPRDLSILSVKLQRLVVESCMLVNVEGIDFSYVMAKLAEGKK